jgi:hypothetical protein
VFTASGTATTNFQNVLGGSKKFANLETVVKKFNGKKNSLTFKFKNNDGKDTTLVVGTDFTAKAEIATDDVEYAGDRKDVNKYGYWFTDKKEKTVGSSAVNSYTKKGTTLSTTSEGAIENRVNIRITGKKNYTGTFVVTGCEVKNLETQRIITDKATISGTTLEFGSADKSLIDGIVLNDDTAVKKTEFPSSVKFKAITKNIKINTKNGTVTVKKIGDSDEANTAKVTITDKKNKSATAEIVFTVTAKAITDSAFTVNAEKYIGTKANPKYVKSMKDIADKIGETGKKLVVSYKKKVNGKDKVVKLKGGSSKDYVSAITFGSIEQIEDTQDENSSAKIYELKDKEGTDTGVYVFKDDAGNMSLVNTLTYDITGVGNYKDTMPGSFAAYKMAPQVVSGTSAISDAVIKFGEAKEKVYDFISVDNDALNGTGHIKADDAKDFKIKAKSKNIKIDKNGYLVAKKIDGEKGEITVTAKKNKKATITLEFNLACADISKATVNKDALGKTFGNASKATAAVNKISVSFNGKKLKKGTDYDLDPSLSDNDKGKITGTVTISGKGNFEGSEKTESVSISYKYVAPTNS